MLKPAGIDANRTALCDATDAARGVLATIVLCGHFAQIFIIAGWPVDVFGLGAQLAVLFFFAISGFVIGGSLARHIERTGRADIVEFAKRRFFRIGPPLLAVFALILIIEALLVVSGALDRAARAGSHWGFQFDVVKSAASLLTLGAIGDLGGGLDGPLWSLRLEIRCYVSAAVLVWLFTSRAPLNRKALVLAGFVAYWYVGLFVHNGGIWNSALASLVAFAAGFLAYKWRSRLSALGPIGWTAACLIVGLSTIVISMSDAPAAVIFAQCSCGLGFVLLVVLMHDIPIRSRALAAMGSVSYTLYILHFPLLLAAFLIIMPLPHELYWPLAILAFGITAVVCYAAGLALERPSQQRRWLERRASLLAPAIRKAWLIGMAPVGARGNKKARPRGRSRAS